MSVVVIEHLGINRKKLKWYLNYISFFGVENNRKTYNNVKIRAERVKLGKYACIDMN